MDSFISKIQRSLVSKLILSVGFILLLTISTWSYFSITYQKKNYALLFLLRQRLERAAARGVDVSGARRLLAELPPHVEQSLLNTGRRVPLNPDGVSLYDDTAGRLKAARAEIISACLRLGEGR